MLKVTKENIKWRRYGVFIVNLLKTFNMISKAYFEQVKNIAKIEGVIYEL